MQAADKLSKTINGYLFAVYHTKNADSYKQTTARQKLIDLLAGEILRQWEDKQK